MTFETPCARSGHADRDVHREPVTGAGDQPVGFDLRVVAALWIEAARSAHVCGGGGVAGRGGGTRRLDSRAPCRAPRPGGGAPGGMTRAAAKAETFAAAIMPTSWPSFERAPTTRASFRQRPPTSR